MAKVVDRAAWLCLRGPIRYQTDADGLRPVYTPDLTVVAPGVFMNIQVQQHTACFGAGTLVHTIDGPRKIETIAAGDRVLAQDTSTGGALVPAGARHARERAVQRLANFFR